MNPQQATALGRDITRTLHGCAAGPLAPRAAALLNALGYHSDKTQALAPNTFAGFRDAFLEGRPFSEDKALAAQWKSIDLLFQYTDAEVKASGQMALEVFADPRFNPGTYQSFLFFAVDLAGEAYTRTELAQATREINRPFPMPAIVVFRHGQTLTLAVIDRRLNKRDDTRDVLEKVTLIKDIRLDPAEEPHRAHVEILADLALDNLTQNYTVTNFETLHAAWRKTLDTAALNKKFYKELADWYFWAREHVIFPPQAGVTAEVNHATSVIRLITRLMFTWFLKERGLVPDELFDDRALPGLLQAPDLTGTGSTYYKAVLQNLFFATLNTEMDDPAHPRRFRGRNKAGGSDGHYGIASVMRYDDSFRDTEAALALFKTIPFLNGGLFECLDQNAKGVPRVLVDGFSDRADNPLSVPNYLFFAAPRDVDLNAVYGTSGKSTKVRGLLTILNSYKFTVAENTPIEEEIALDPELLGRVFENLLASYNPETGATARKQTGSFYTPREIVNYMVDEALIASLETALSPSTPASVGAPLAAPSSPSPSTPFPNREGSALAPGVGSEGLGLNARLRHLFAYNTDAPDFTPAEVNALISAIDALKILDPACGSGAFPMGILQKLVFVLGKLDPQNAKWRDRQIAKAELIDDPTARDHAVADINQAFDKNDLDYGRKLYLISNGIYGVDIQPIAMQIAKLRFFISLIIDQQIDDTAKNRGVRALPNLETKFVAANTLLGIDRPKDETLTLDDREVSAKQNELAKVRARYFNARTPATKAKCKEEDKQLRADLSALLESSGMPHDTALRLAGWDPYNQNQSADFFDAKRMFSNPDGFDIIIGNPPYSSKQSVEMRKIAAHYKLVEYKCDPYAFFIEKGLHLLKKHGYLAYIVPVTWMTNFYYFKLRTALIETSSLEKVVLVDGAVFDQANVDTSLVFLHKEAVKRRAFDWIRTTPDLLTRNPISRNYSSLKKEERFDIVPEFDDEWQIVKATMEKDSVRLGDISKISLGMKLQGNDNFVSQTKDQNHSDPIFFGKDISLYGALKPSRFFDYSKAIIIGGTKNPKVYASHPEDFLVQAIRNLSLKRRIVATLDDKPSYFIGTVNGIVVTNRLYDTRYVLGVLNSALVNTYFRSRFTAISLTSAFLGVLPVPNATPAEQAPVIALVDAILDAKRASPTANITAQEAELDRLVNALYGLAPETIPDLVPVAEDAAG